MTEKQRLALAVLHLTAALVILGFQSVETYQTIRKTFS